MFFSSGGLSSQDRSFINRTVRTQVQTVSYDLGSLEENVGALGTQLADLSLQQDASATAITDLDTRVTTLEAGGSGGGGGSVDLTPLETAVTQLQTDVTAINTTNDSQQTAITQLNQSLATLDITFYTKATKLNAIAAPNGSLALNSQKITGLANPTASTDGANKTYVDGRFDSLNNILQWNFVMALEQSGYLPSSQSGMDFGYMQNYINSVNNSLSANASAINSATSANTTQNTRLTAIEAKNTQQDTTVATLNTSVTTLGTRVTTLENAGTGVTQAQLNSMIYATKYLQRYCGPTLAYIQYSNSGLSYTIWGGLKYMLPINLLSVSHMTIPLSGGIVAAASDNISLNLQGILDKLSATAISDYLGYQSVSYRLQYDTTVTLRGNSGGGTPTTICVPAYSSYNGALQNTNSTAYNSNLTGGKPFESIMNAAPQTTTIERAKDTGVIAHNTLCYHAVGIHNTSDTSYILRQYKVDIRISLVLEVQDE